MIHDGSRNPSSQKNTQTIKQKRTPTATTNNNNKKVIGKWVSSKSRGTDRHTDGGWTLPPPAELADCIICVASKVNLL
jgi:hypothetical protein